MDDSALITLPHGLWVGGQRQSTVMLRPIVPEDERFLLESTGNPSVVRANSLLTRCLEFPRELSATSPVDVSALVIGDREALLLQMQRLTFGDAFASTFSCSSQACAQTLELELRVDDLLVPSYADAALSYSRRIHHSDVDYDVRFRLPTAGDQEEVVLMARRDTEQAALHLLHRCVERIVANGQEINSSDLPEPVTDEIASAMGELDPQAVVELNLACPACGSTNQMQFDAADFLLRKLDKRVDRAIREVHTLALSYHWSEEAILNMPADRRQKYLDLIAAGAEFTS